jgi:hypothetical protein
MFSRTRTPTRSLPTVLAIAAAVSLALAGCTTGQASTTEAASPAPTPSSTTAAVRPGLFPTCAQIQTAMGPLVTGLTLDEQAAANQITDEDYDQFVCVWAAADGQSGVGVTLSGITILDTEMAQFAEGQTVIDDQRAADLGAILQTLDLPNGPTDHLPATLLLFDTTLTVAIMGSSADGDTVDELPQLTIGAASDAAFAVFALARAL